MTSKHTSNIFGQQLPFNVWKMQGNQSHYACHGVMCKVYYPHQTPDKDN